MRVLCFACLVLLFGLSCFQLPALADDNVFFRDHFESLANWEPLFFPKVKRHSVYEIVRSNSESKNVLKMSSDGSASALVSRVTFDPHKFPILRWRWKTEATFPDLDPMAKSGDDYPIRVYVIFDVDDAQKSMLDRLRDRTAKLIYGDTPPYSTLVYVWAGKPFPEKCISSPYTGRGKLIAKQTVPGDWRTEEVNISDDYKYCFGEELPLRARLAIMSDSDNSNRQATALVDFIEVRCSTH